MSTTNAKRKDSKGRVLYNNEFQKGNGRYEYRYYDTNNEMRSVYSWKLTESDRLPKGKRECVPLRDLETRISKAASDEISIYKAERTTLNQCFDSYIESKVELRQSTRNNYIYMYNNYVRYVIGNRTIADIKYTDVLKYYKSLIFEKHFKPNSMETIHTILNPIFNNAVRDGLIRNNPCFEIMKKIKSLKEWDKNKRVALTLPQQKAFMTYINSSKVYSKWVPLMTILLGTGMRVGEFTGLTWDDCDFEKNEISINHSLIYRQQTDGSCEYHIEKPKTNKGIRTIPMFTEVRNALIVERERQKQIGTNGTVIDGYSNWVFTNRHKTVFSPASINRVIDRIVADYNTEENKTASLQGREPLLLPHFSCHHLRHTFCTRLCENESRVKIIQEIMGHADISTTMDIYADVSNELKQESFKSLQGKVYIG